MSGSGTGRGPDHLFSGSNDRPRENNLTKGPVSPTFLTCTIIVPSARSAFCGAVRNRFR